LKLATLILVSNVIFLCNNDNY